MSESAAAQMSDLSGRVAVVSGANSGLGYETARLLAAQEATVVMACRDLDKANDAAKAITAALPAASLEVCELDLADLGSIRRFVAELAGRHREIDLLVNNAGLMAIPRRETADGFELQFGTNYLGHFALTGLLLPQLLAAERARVVSLSSLAHVAGRITFDDLQGARRYGRVKAYCQSKLAVLLFAYELQRRSAEAATRLLSVACHPGYCRTNLFAVGPQMRGHRPRTTALLLALFAQDADRGAETVVFAATAPGVRGGAYYGPKGLFQLKGLPPREVRSAPRSHDRQAATRLWSISEQLTGVHYGF